MAKYQNILIGYVNDRKNGDGRYLVITNVADFDVNIPAGEKIYLNVTPKEIREKHPKAPHFSKSIKLDEDDTQTNTQTKGTEEIDMNDLPF